MKLLKVFLFLSFALTSGLGNTHAGLRHTSSDVPQVNETSSFFEVGSADWQSGYQSFASESPGAFSHKGNYKLVTVDNEPENDEPLSVKKSRKGQPASLLHSERFADTFFAATHLYFSGRVRCCLLHCAPPGHFSPCKKYIYFQLFRI